MEVRVNLGETGMGRVLPLRTSVLFYLRCLMKLTQKTKKTKTKKTKNKTNKTNKTNKKKHIYIYLSYEIFTDIKASRDEFTSLVSTLYRIRKVSKP